MSYIVKIKNFIENKYKIIIIIFFVLFLILGLLAVKDYGLSTDEGIQRNLGNKAINLILNNDRSIYEGMNKYHGTTFTLILTATERIFKIDDTRTIFLLRHYVTFLLFYISVVFFYFLCRNIFRSWKLGLLGSIFLVLSPRILADSFYNPKDLPFLSMFIISIFTLYRFLETRNIKFAFIHGLATGFASGMRILGIMIPFFTILFFIINLVLERKQKKDDEDLETAKKFRNLLIYLFVAIVVFLILMPSMLTDPVNRFIAAIKTMSDYPHTAFPIYMGQHISSTDALPWHYLPVNMLIMIPATYTVLFLIGVSYFISRFRKNLGLFYDTNKFIILAVLWFFIPVIGVILIGSNLYNGWRQMYFVYPAFLIIALNGVKFLYDILFKKISTKYYNFAAVIITIILVLNLAFICQLVIRMHPYLYLYYNIFAGKNLGEVQKRFSLDYWELSTKEGLEYILKTDNRQVITYTTRCGTTKIGEPMLTASDRKKIFFVADFSDADYFVNTYKCFGSTLVEEGLKPEYLENKVYSIIVDNAEILTVYKLK